MFEASLQGAVQVVRGTSALNVDSLENFEETLSDLLRGGQPMTVFDMTGIPLIDSRGLEALLICKSVFVGEAATSNCQGSILCVPTSCM